MVPLNEDTASSKGIKRGADKVSGAHFSLFRQCHVATMILMQFLQDCHMSGTCRQADLTPIAFSLILEPTPAL